MQLGKSDIASYVALAKRNVALHHAARHQNPELFLEILKTEEGRKTLSSYNKEKESPVDILIQLDKVDLINEVLKTPEGALLINGDEENKSLVELLYRKSYEDEVDEDKIKRALSTLLKCNISLDPIKKFEPQINTTGYDSMLDHALDNENDKVFDVLINCAELRKQFFSLVQYDQLEAALNRNLIDEWFKGYWLEMLKYTEPQDMYLFVKVVLQYDLFNEIIDKLDKEYPALLSKMLDSLVSDNTPISSELDEELSKAMSKENVRKWLLSVQNHDANKMYFKRLLLNGLDKTVEAILNDDILRRSIFLQDMLGNTFLHFFEIAGNYKPIIDREGNVKEQNCFDDLAEHWTEVYYNCLPVIFENQYLLEALPRLLSTKNVHGDTPLNSLAKMDDVRLFLLYLVKYSVRPENVSSLDVLDNKGRTPFYNILLEGYRNSYGNRLDFVIEYVDLINMLTNANTKFVSSIFDHVDNEMVNVISRILDDEECKIAFYVVCELVKDKPVLMRKFIDSVGHESKCSSLEYARKHGMQTIVDAISAFNQNTALVLSAPSASLETRATSSTATDTYIPAVGAVATVSIPAHTTSSTLAKRGRDDDDNDYDDKTEEYKRRRQEGRSPDRG